MSYFCHQKLGWWKTHCLWIYSGHAVSWGVNDFCHQCCKKIIWFQIACQFNVRFIHINCFTMENTSLYWFAIVNSWPCHHNDYEVMHCHGSIQQKMHCLWVHCVSFTFISCQWERMALHKRIIWAVNGIVKQVRKVFCLHHERSLMNCIITNKVSAFCHKKIDDYKWVTNRSHKLANVSKVIHWSWNMLSSLEWKYFAFDHCICSHKGWMCYGQMKPPLMMSDHTVQWKDFLPSP